MTTKDLMEIYLNPEKHGYVECDHCNGYGSSLRESADRCTKCGGIGVVKKAEEVKKDGGE